MDAAAEAISGAAGSVLALLATYPLKTIYTLQALHGQGGGQRHQAALSVVDVVSKYKLSGLYVGIGPNIFESALSSGVYFYLYSKLRAVAVKASGRRSCSKADAATCSGDVQDSGGGAADGAAAPAAPQPRRSTKNADIGVLASLLVAALAGAGNQLVTMPAGVVTTRMQARQKARIDAGTTVGASGAASVIAEVWRESGLAGFWEGLLPSLVLVANPAVQYMLYEQLLALLRRWRAERAARTAAAAAAAEAARTAEAACTGKAACTAAAACKAEAPCGGVESRRAGGEAAPNDDNATSVSRGSPSEAADVELSPLEIFCASALAKVGATVATYPMIVIKSRMQATGKSSGPVRYNGTRHAISRTFQDEGIGGFFKGLRAKILQTALNAALMLMLKEQCFKVTRGALLTWSGAVAPPAAGASTLATKSCDGQRAQRQLIN